MVFICRKSLIFRLSTYLSTVYTKNNITSSQKLEIKDLGDVNTGSIEEYNRLNTRYEFLKNQEKDLIIAKA